MDQATGATSTLAPSLEAWWLAIPYLSHTCTPPQVDAQSLLVLKELLLGAGVALRRRDQWAHGSGDRAGSPTKRTDSCRITRRRSPRLSDPPLG